jgi:alanine racemase
LPSKTRFTRKEYEDAWNLLTIDLDALKSNYRTVKDRLPESSVLYAVMKSDAYGHGIIEAGSALSAAGCRHFAVETPHEGIILRNEGITGEILVMNPVPVWMSELCVKHNLSVSVIDESILEPLEEACRDHDTRCSIHLNANVGLNRMGISPSRIIKIARKAREMPHLEMRGLYGQSRNPENALNAFEKLRAIEEKLAEEGLKPSHFHFANSTTLLSYPETVAGGVRIGILLYGVLPPEQADGEIDMRLRPVMTVSSKVVQLRTLAAGSRVGYRSKSKTDREIRVATIPMGYYHGLDRKLSGTGQVLIRGRRAPFIGALSMNASTVDVSDIPDVVIGDPVVIAGRQGDEEILLEELAAASKTISAELMIRLGQGGIARRHVETRGDLAASNGELGGISDISLDYLQTEKDFPGWLTAGNIADFLSSNMDYYGDSIEMIMNAIDFALSSIPQGDGFLIIAAKGKEILGALVNARTGTGGFIPENIFVYVCVERNHRRKGLAKAMLKEAVGMSEGAVKLHVEKDNPARELYRKLGFDEQYVEMRYRRGDNEQ